MAIRDYERRLFMCTELQLNMINREMAKCYRQIFGNDIIDIFLYGSYWCNCVFPEGVFKNGNI